MNGFGIKTGCLLVWVAVFAIDCSTIPSNQRQREPYEATGMASYYADSLHGSKTAGGKRIQNEEWVSD